MRMHLLFVGALAGCSPATPAPTDGGACSYDAYEGSCVLTDLWVGPVRDGQVIVEAQYETPQSTETVRRAVPEGEAERWRRHLTENARLPCRGRVLTKGTCDPSHLELELPPLGDGD